MQDQRTRTNDVALQILGDLYTHEVAGVVKYLHYSFLIMGYNRIPIQKWFREQADEGMLHSILVGEKITSLGGEPPFSKTLEASGAHSMNEILAEALDFEEQALTLYHKLAVHAASTNDVALEELARRQISEETDHVDEIRKMLRPPF
jgi:bacterioferritin